jgi:hypothetical protein
MRIRILVVIGLAGAAAFSSIPLPERQAEAQEIQRYTVYCADERIEVAVWDLEQMIVRRGTPVCQFASYTSYGDALNFAKKNFGGEGSDCSC